MGQIEMEKPGASGSLLDGNQQQHLAVATQMSLNTVVKMEAGHPGVQFGFYLKALWALELIDDFTKQMGMVGINETEFALVEANLPKTVRKRSKR